MLSSPPLLNLPLRPPKLPDRRQITHPLTTTILPRHRHFTHSPLPTRRSLGPVCCTGSEDKEVLKKMFDKKKEAVFWKAVSGVSKVAVKVMVGVTVTVCVGRLIKMQRGILDRCRTRTEEWKEVQEVTGFLKSLIIFSGLVDFCWKHVFPGEDEDSILLPKSFPKSTPKLNDIIREFLGKRGWKYSTSDDVIKEMIHEIPEWRLSLFVEAHARVVDAIKAYQELELTNLSDMPQYEDIWNAYAAYQMFQHMKRWKSSWNDKGRGAET